MASFVKIKNFLLYGFILIVVLSVLSPYILNWTVNTSYIKHQISLAISQETGADFDASRFSINLFPNFSISVKDFIFNPDNRTDINIKAINFNLDIKKLLYGKISVTHISIVRPELKKKSSDQLQSNSTFPNLKSPQQLVLSIKNLFTLLPEHQEPVEFTFKDVRTPYFKRMDGSFYLSKEKNQIILNTIIDNIAFKSSELFDTDFKKYYDLDSIKIKKLDCLIKFNSQGEIKGECKLTHMNIKSNSNQLLFDLDNIESSFKISENLYQIDIKPFKLNYPESMVEVHFQDNKIQEKSRLQIRGADIEVDKARQMSLLMFKDNEITDNVFKILHNGIVPEINISVNGKNLDDLFNANNFEIKGNIKKGLIHIPVTSLTASDVYGYVSIKKGVLNINTNKGNINGSKIKKGDLAVDLLNYTDFPFHGEFALDIDLSRITQTLISLLPDTLLSKELRLVHNVTGRADTRLNLSMETLSDDLKVKILTQDFSIVGLYDRIPGSIDLKNINFIYEPDMVHLANINGIINNTAIDDLEIFLNFKNEANIQVISGSGVINLESTIPWLMSLNKKNKFIPHVKNTHGKIYVNSMAISGPIFKMDKWKYNLKGRGADIYITTDSDQKEMENLSFEYHISDESINLNKIHLKINNLSQMENFINKKYLNTVLLPFDINNGNLQIKPKNNFLKGDLNFNKGSILNIEIKGETLKSLYLESIKFYDQEISKGTITFNHDQDMPLFDFNGILNTTTLNKIIKPHSHWGKKLKELTDGQPILISIDKNSNLNITGKSINIDRLATRSEKLSLDHRLFPYKTINFKTEELETKNLTITNVYSKIFLKKDGLDIRLYKAFLCDLETSGYINFANNSVNFKLPIKAENKANIQNLLTCLFQKNKFMDGAYSLTGNLFSETPKKDYLKNIEGSLEFIAKNGHIYKLTLLSRILSVINVSKVFKGRLPNITQDGFRYETIAIEADIKDSIIYLSKAIIYGEDMTLIFTGTIDPLSDKLDLTCLVAPLKTIDLIIEKIPIVNTILEGRIVSLPVKASGKLSDPTVVPLHPSAVGKSLFNMLTNILKSPVRLWQKNDEE